MVHPPLSPLLWQSRFVKQRGAETMEFEGSAGIAISTEDWTGASEVRRRAMMAWGEGGMQ